MSLSCFSGWRWNGRCGSGYGQPDICGRVGSLFPLPATRKPVGALASRQSQVVASRQILDQRFEQLAAQYPDDDIPMAYHWGGYRVKPDLLEFWQGRHGRMHDRLRYRPRNEGGWLLERLEP